MPFVVAVVLVLVLVAPAQAAERCARSETAIDVRKHAKGRLVVGTAKRAERTCVPAKPVLGGALRRVEARVARRLPAGARRVRLPARLTRLRSAVASAAAGLQDRRLTAVPEVASGRLDLAGAPAGSTTTGTFTRDPGGPDEVGLITDAQVVSRLGRVGIGGGSARGALVKRCPDAAGQVTGRFVAGSSQSTVREAGGRRYVLTVGFRTTGTLVGTAADDARAKAVAVAATGRLSGAITVEDVRTGRALPGGASFAMEAAVRHPGFDPRGPRPTFDDAFVTRGIAPPGATARDLATTAALAFSEALTQAAEGLLRAEEAWYGPETPSGAPFGACVSIAFDPAEASVAPGGTVPVTARLRAQDGADPAVVAWKGGARVGALAPTATTGAPAGFTYTAPAEDQGGPFLTFEVLGTSRRGRALAVHAARHPARTWTATVQAAGSFTSTSDADCGNEREEQGDPSSTARHTGVLFDPAAWRRRAAVAVDARGGTHRQQGRYRCGTSPPERAWSCERPWTAGAWLGADLSTAPRPDGGWDVVMTTARFRPPGTPLESDPGCTGPDFPGARRDTSVPQHPDEQEAVTARFVVTAAQVASGSFDVPVGATPALSGCGFDAPETTCTRTLRWEGQVRFRRDG